jgi:hypothetical protein
VVGNVDEPGIGLGLAIVPHQLRGLLVSTVAKRQIAVVKKLIVWRKSVTNVDRSSGHSTERAILNIQDLLGVVEPVFSVWSRFSACGVRFQHVSPFSASGAVLSGLRSIRFRGPVLVPERSARVVECECAGTVAW